jgi:hypothetical protein
MVFDIFEALRPNQFWRISKTSHPNEHIGKKIEMLPLFNYSIFKVLLMNFKRIYKAQKLNFGQQILKYPQNTVKFQILPCF